VHQLLYITCADHAEAERLAEALLKANLIACGNIIPAVRSLFRWQGAISRSDEVLLVAKSLKPHFQIIETTVRKLHSYDL